MHEMSIITAVLQTANQEQRKIPGSRVTKIGLRIGEWAGVDRESLRFCFDALVADQEHAPSLEIEYLERRNHCERCGETFGLKDLDPACPACGSSLTTPISGDELDVAYIELEEL